jgi:hypothetical protein
MRTNAERLLHAVQNLPEPLIAEVLDFAEFLQARRVAPDHAKPALALTDLCGGLDDFGAFQGSPLNIQKALRDEWR